MKPNLNQQDNSGKTTIKNSEDILNKSMAAHYHTFMNGGK
jgi:hypothetical protein